MLCCPKTHRKVEGENSRHRDVPCVPHGYPGAILPEAGRIRRDGTIEGRGTVLTRFHKRARVGSLLNCQLHEDEDTTLPPHPRTQVSSEGE